MKLVLLSGGSGKRLWPLSNDARSKQFLKMLENDNKELVSMVQRVWGQITSNELERFQLYRYQQVSDRDHAKSNRF